MCAFLLGKREEVELLGRGVCICLRLVDAIKQLSNLMYQSIFPLTVNGSSSCCTLLPTLDIVFFHVHYSDEYTVAVHCSFKFHFCPVSHSFQKDKLKICGHMVYENMWSHILFKVQLL